MLAVDDDPAHLAILRGLLVPLGFRLSCAADSESALALAAEVQPDLVLCDIALGGEDGRALADKLARRHGPALRIVMVSGEGAPPDAGGFPFVGKPFDFDALLAVIAESLALEWVRAPGGDSSADAP
ncbi:MAG: response regulator, partial [Erythrobacter sp.]